MYLISLHDFLDGKAYDKNLLNILNLQMSLHVLENPKSYIAH